MGTELHGFCEPAFTAVGEAFRRGFEDRGDVGGAVAVHLNGSLVVDLWAGHSDTRERRPWDAETIVHAYSVSKPFVATCALLLADRGELDLDAPVSDYWPEYAQAGKEDTLVRHLLTHQSGLLVLREPQPSEALLDWERVTGLLAAEPPLWEPGTRHGECAGFYGHLVGEVVRRVDGRSLGRFLAEEIAGPWGLDFHVGLGPAEQVRCARLLDPDGSWRRSIRDDPRRWVEASLDNPPGMLDVDVVNSTAYRAAEVPAVNGHGSARAIARFYGGLAAGGDSTASACSGPRPSRRRCARTPSDMTSSWRTMRPGASASASTGTTAASASAASEASAASASAGPASRSATGTSRAPSEATSEPRPASTPWRPRSWRRERLGAMSETCQQTPAGAGIAQ